MISRQTSSALIFGGSGIIGQAIAKTFGQNGWTVGLHYHRNKAAAEKAVDDIKKTGGKASLFQADVKHAPQLHTLLETFLDAHATLDVFIWAVGTTASAHTVKTSSENWINTLQTNLTGAYLALKEAAPTFQRQHNGSVILIGSLSSQQGHPGQAAYAASKAGLVGLMKSLAQEWGTHNIRVNIVFPGWHRSPLTSSTFNSALQLSPHVLHRTPDLDQIAQMVYHLALADHISGQIWNLDNRIW
jgi:3-oxoacyl-[acyl-carrier protein] reductase